MNYILPTHQSDPEATTNIDFADHRADELGTAWNRVINLTPGEQPCHR